ncbi:uncharacterized protein LOC106866347 [Brachypodium distachyon]|uniref:uncharacterized protein LOC106866347 n=1 Tax=Brachypodium distachyon TaxID=15368 RepID=UPI000D0DD920|nr:uncharacterized protein LOC106866347 [Brachypodium distachyon]|eukprot:XP_024318177.1 uncharacterized protein LOC106866347 [Brachypodium distachyon]
MQHGEAFACVYSSETGLWGNFISALLPSDVPTTTCDIQILASDVILMTPTMYFTGKSASTVQVGDSLYWLVNKVFLDNSSSILELDLNGQSINVIPVPMEEKAALTNCHMCVMRAKGGGLGFLYLSYFSAQFWKRKTDCNGVASWQLGRAIELDKLLSLKIERKGRPYIIGFASQNNVVFLWTRVGIFMLQLDSLQFKKIFEIGILNWPPCYYPYESVYDAGTGGGQDGAELLQDAED